MMTKKEVRDKIRILKSQLSPQAIQESSRIICNKAFRLLKNREPSIIALFMSMNDEVNTEPLIDLLWEQGKHQVAIPRVEDRCTMRFYSHNPHKRLKLSRYGIWEPSEDATVEMIPQIMIVPGVAFDHYGGRVGYGRGYYDRYFLRHKEIITDRIALCFEMQILNQVPMEDFDQRMTQLITEHQIISF